MEKVSLPDSQLRPQPSIKLDAFRARYALLFVVLFLVNQLLGINKNPDDFDIAGILFFLASGSVLAVYFLVIVAVSVYRLQWRRLLSMLIVPGVAIGLFQAQLYTGFTPDYGRLLLGRSRYLDQVQQIKGSDAAFYAWPWDRTGGVASTPTRTLLIYDETDQLLLPPDARSTDWKRRALSFRSADYLDLRSFVDPTRCSHGDTAPSIRRLDKHFYLVTTR